MGKKRGSSARRLFWVMRLILLGPPGSGKGTMANLLNKKLNYKVISVGKILRKESKKKTKLGKLIDKMIDKGNLVPDRLVNKIVKDKIKHKANLVIDGYPRNLMEAKFIFKAINIDKVFLLKANKKLLIKRLNKRHREKKRDDDTKEAIKHRFKVYNKKTIPAIDYFKKNNLLVNIDANKTINGMFKELKSKLK